MTVRSIGFVGVRTERYDEMVQFASKALGLGNPVSRGDDFAVFEMADGTRFEVFGPTCPSGAHLGAAPLVGFLVDDVGAARARIEAAGNEVVFAGEDGPHGWAHFLGPDGNLYEVMHDKSEPTGS